MHGVDCYFIDKEKSNLVPMLSMVRASGANTTSVPGVLDFSSEVTERVDCEFSRFPKNF